MHLLVKQGMYGTYGTYKTYGNYDSYAIEFSFSFSRLKLKFSFCFRLEQYFLYAEPANAGGNCPFYFVADAVA